MNKWLKKHKNSIVEATLQTMTGFAVTFTVLSVAVEYTDSSLIKATLITGFAFTKSILWRTYFKNLNRRK